MTVDELLALNPFPGLRPFTSGEADRFFGRQQQIDELAALLAGARLVGVAGASGCGKSSLVLAGLTSELAHRRAQGDDIEWRPVIMRPGNHSIANLAQALSGALGMAGDEARTDALYGRLSLGALGLVEAIRGARLELNVRVLVIVDQFEEIFRFRHADPEEPSAFVKLLLTAVQDRDTPIGVVLTMRSGELGKCADFPDLAEAVSRGQYLVPKLSRDQRKEAIQKPVEQAGFKIAPSLVQRILNDVSDDFDDLPVMQHVLTRTWQHWARTSEGQRPISLDDYKAVGAAERALSQHADEAYASLPGLEPLVEKVFRALTERVDGAIENRRPLEFDRLCAVTGADPADVAQVIERFRRPDTAFLMPPPSVPLATNPVIDISHESLIRQWERLRGWAKAETDSRTALMRVVDAARRYANDEGDLAYGRDLERMLAWRRGAQPTAAWVGLYTGADGEASWRSAQSFLDASEREARKSRRRHLVRIWTVRGLALATVIVSVVAAVFASRAERAARAAGLVSQAQLHMDRNPALAAERALLAFGYDETNQSAIAAMRQAVAQLDIVSPERIIDFDQPIDDARFNRDESRLVVAGGGKVTVYDAASYEPLHTFDTKPRNMHRAWLAGDKLLMLTNDLQASIGNADGSGARERIACTSGKDGIAAIAVSPDEQHLAIACTSGEILRRPLAAGTDSTWTQLRPPGNALRNPFAGADYGSYIGRLAFSADATYVAFTDGKTVTIWKGAERRTLPPEPVAAAHKETINEVWFTAGQPARLVTRSNDAVVFWNVQFTAAPFAASQAANGLRNSYMSNADVSLDGRYVAIASEKGKAWLSSLQTGKEVAVLSGHRAAVTRIMFRHRGAQAGGPMQVITASRDKTLRVWRVRPPQLLVADNDEPKDKLTADADPAGKRIVVCGSSSARGRTPCSVFETAEEADRAGKHIDLQDSGDPNYVKFVSWSPDGKWIVGRRLRDAPGATASPALWDADTGIEKTPAWLREWESAMFSAAANELLTVKRDGHLAVWDNASLLADAAQPKQALSGTPGLRRAVISPNGRWIATFGEGGKIGLWDRRENAAHARMLRDATADAHAGVVSEVRFSPDSRYLVSASIDQTAKIWDMNASPAAQVLPQLLSAEGAFVRSAAFSGDGRLVVTGTDDGRIGLWERASGRNLAWLKQHDAPVAQVRFEATGHGFISASTDGTVKLGRCEACELAPAQLAERIRKLPKPPQDTQGATAAAPRR